MLQTGLRANTVEEEVEDGAVVTREMTVSGSGVTVTGGGAGADYHEVKHRSHDRVRIEIKKAREMKDKKDARERGGGILTVGASVGLSLVFEGSAEDVGSEPPMVPDTLPSIWMYMNRLLSLSPHFSAGKPGQSFWQSLMSAVSPGA